MIKENKRMAFFWALIFAFIGGLIFSYLAIPIPWLLGPMSAMLITSRFKGIFFYWPSYLRDAALVIVGYSIGLSFTREAVINILTNLPMMLILTILLVSSAALMAFFISKLSGVDYPTVLTGSIPGGLSQMIIFAEENKGINITTVTFLQVSRLLMIVFFVPFIIFGPVLNMKHTDLVMNNIVKGTVSPAVVFLFGAICIVAALIGKKLKFPTPFLLGPILGTALLMNVGFQGPLLPSFILDVSQFMIGGYIGLLLKPEKLERKTTSIILALLSGLVLVTGSLAISIYITDVLNISIVTSFLSLAPGGMDQMGIIAHEVNADLSMVTGFQLFRLFFIYFAVPPFLRWYFKRKFSGEEESLYD
ncbi:AbrB family transcriptional regulator [Heyndrickxia sp. MSNUG]|uniref:AbrB family transcriptional regulator n=1 Tax=Heyndrickxia sp. MSNUG TaxID=3136677 RepID=UPI003C2E90D8